MMEMDILPKPIAFVSAQNEGYVPDIRSPPYPRLEWLACFHSRNQ